MRREGKVPLTHLKRAHLEPGEARSCGILRGDNGISLEREYRRTEMGGEGAHVPLLDPAGGGARAAAERLRMRLRLRRRVVVVASSPRRRVFHAGASSPSPSLLRRRVSSLLPSLRPSLCLSRVLRFSGQ